MDKPDNINSKQLEIKGSLLVRNSLLNFIGQVIPLLVGVISIPFVVKGLGAERFGVLSLSWVVLGYLAIFDFGIGRATTKFVAEALGKNEIKELPQLVWTSFTLQLILGMIGGLITIALIPHLVGCVLNIPPALLKETKSVFLLMGLSIPIILGSGTFSGVLSAAQRFDLINTVRIPSSSVTYLLPAVALSFNSSLPTIVLMLLLARLCTALVYFFLCINVFPVLKQGFSFDCGRVKSLFIYGGWVTVSCLVNPVLLYLDRFIIGSVLTIAAVTYYIAPYEVVTRLWILPASLTMSVFPASSALWSKQANQELEQLYVRSIKYLLLIVCPSVLTLILFATEILGFWLGPDFAQKSSLVFQILATGILINSLAHVPHCFLQGVGRPDITAKFHLLETPLYVVLVWFLVKNSGIVGAALAWSLRVTFDAFLLFGITWKMGLTSSKSLIENGFLRSLMGLLILFGVTILALLLSLDLSTRIILIIFAVITFGTVTWHYALDRQDKGLFVSLVKRLTSTVLITK